MIRSTTSASKPLDVDSDAGAASALGYGTNTELVDGEKGKGDFRQRNQDFLPNN